MEIKEKRIILELIENFSVQSKKIIEQEKLIDEMKWLLGHAVRIAKWNGEEKFLKKYMAESSVPFCQSCEYIVDLHPKILCRICSNYICHTCVKNYEKRCESCAFNEDEDEDEDNLSYDEYLSNEESFSE